MELRPNRNISESVLHDRRSINFLKSFLPDDCVDCSQLQDGGTLPNIDGYLEILDKHGIAQEKIIVQVKHLTYPEENGKVFYDIPESVYAYAEIHKGELVFFIACDYASRKFYWRNIDTTAIEEFKNKLPSKSLKINLIVSELRRDIILKTTKNVVKRMLKRPSSFGVSCTNRRWSPSRMISIWQTSLLRGKKCTSMPFLPSCMG